MVGTVRRRRRVLILVNIVLALALCGGVPMLALAPVESRRPAEEPDVVVAAKSPSDRAPTARALSEYACIYQRSLRKPLFDVVAAPLAVVAPPKPPMTVTAVGTVMEPGFTYAMLRDKGGKVRYAAVGEEVDGVKVLVIGESGVTVEFAGDRIELSVGKGGGK